MTTNRRNVLATITAGTATALAGSTLKSMISRANAAASSGLISDGSVVSQNKAPLIEVPGLPTRLFLESSESMNRLSVVEHTLGPALLGAPMHTHHNEDEYSFVMEGTLSAQLGDEVVHVAPGSLLKKPRGIPHAFWNEGTTPLRFVEMISPGGFERFFIDIAKLDPNSFKSPDDYMAEIARVGETGYNVVFDFSGLEELMTKHSLTM